MHCIYYWWWQETSRNMYSIKSVAIFLRFIVSLIISRPFGKIIYYKLNFFSEVLNNHNIYSTSTISKISPPVFCANIASKRSPSWKEAHPSALKRKEAHGLVFEVLLQKPFMAAWLVLLVRSLLSKKKLFIFMRSIRSYNLKMNKYIGQDHHPLNTTKIHYCRLHGLMKYCIKNEYEF